MNKAVIAAGHALTAEAAQHILQAGGNAADAMVAALFTACVVEPVLASLGGGGFALVQAAAGGKAELLDFFTQTPLHKTSPEDADFYAATVDFGSATQDFHIGTGSIATPGMISGLFELHRRHGSLPMRELTAFAAQQAKQGVPICAYQGYILSLVEPIFLSTPAAKQLYESANQTNKVLQASELLVNPALADTLEILGLEGERLFYEGEIAAAMCAQCAQGGHLQTQDLLDYRTELRHPLTFHYKDWQILTNPPPAAGGSLISFALSLLQTLAPHLGRFASREHVLAVREALALTQEARLANTLANGIPDFLALADPALIQRYQAEVLQRSRAYRGTTHISILDAQGNAVSATVSNGEGCGHIVPGTGFMLNNMLGEEDLNPNGFFRWHCNERMSSMMSPTIAHHPQGDLMVLGTGGSNRIRSAIVQVLLNLLHYELSVTEAVDAARLHVEQDMTYIEGGFSTEAAQALIEYSPAYRQWDQQNMFFGGVHTVTRRKGQSTGAGDSRRGGVAVVV
ncbi:MAG: Gamma-glutamyltranspeptidase [Proteobacteria bacterium]|nr:MAG: Gamma-glutamyltranspeptidase [Pseudomonadota bacterium]